LLAFLTISCSWDLVAWAQIRTVREPKLRVQIVSQRSEFDEDPASFMAKYESSQR
jgi:magnesium chelatase subunit I